MFMIAPDLLPARAGHEAHYAARLVQVLAIIGRGGAAVVLGTTRGTPTPQKSDTILFKYTYIAVNRLSFVCT